MAQVAETKRKVILTINEGTASAEELKNRPIGSSYYFKPSATDEQCYTSASYWGAFSAYPIKRVEVQDVKTLVSD